MSVELGVPFHPSRPKGLARACSITRSVSALRQGEQEVGSGAGQARKLDGGERLGPSSRAWTACIRMPLGEQPLGDAGGVEDVQAVRADHADRLG